MMISYIIITLIIIHSIHKEVICMKRRFTIRIISVVLTVLLIFCAGLTGADVMSSFTLDVSAETQTPTSHFTFELNSTGTYTIKKFTGSETNVVIPSYYSGKPVETIGWQAFADSAITRVVMPSTIMTIEESAFVRCSDLREIVWSVNLTCIKSYGFASCSSLKWLELPKNLYRIDENAFHNCISLTGVLFQDVYGTIYQKGMFNNCDDVIIYGSKGGNAEYYANKYGILFEDKSKFRTQIADDFIYTTHKEGVSLEEYTGKQTANVTAPDTVNGLPVFRLGSRAFENTHVESVVLPEGITKICPYAFSGCSDLRTVSIPDGVDSLKTGAFYGCTGLESVSLPDSITSLGESAFYGCTALTDITFPDKLTSLSRNVCRNCTGLERVTIGESVSSIPAGAFYGCKKLKYVVIPPGVTSIQSNSFYNCADDLTIYGEPGSYAETYADKCGFSFKDADDLPPPGSFETVLYTEDTIAIIGYEGILKDVVIPDQIDGKYVAVIGIEAFADHTEINSIVLPEHLEYIDQGAFYGCTGLQSIDIPAGTKAINTGAFYGCTSLKEITLPDSLSDIGSYAFCYCSSLTDIIIPDGIEQLYENTFYGCSSLTSVVLPDQLTGIDTGCFEDCSSLSDIQLPDKLNCLGENVFSGCTSLKMISLPDGITEIPSYTFCLCTGLSIVSLPDSLTAIREGAFGKCSSLKRISLPGRLTEIGKGAFIACTDLTSITLPDNVVSMESYALAECTKLETVQLSGKLNAIAPYVFAKDSALTALTVPGRVVSIGEAAFWDCTSLQEVTIPKTVTEIDTNAFYGCTGLTICGKSGSAAESFAKEKGFSFKADLMNRSSVSARTITLGKSITVNCLADGGKAPYTYAVYYRKAGYTNWTVVQGYKSNASVTVTPKAAVNYEIRVAVKDADGNIVRKDMTVTVKKPLLNNSRLGADIIRLGEKVKVRCFAEGGAGDYQYAVYYKKQASSNWTRLRDYGTGNIIMLTPKAATTYDVRVKVKDKSGIVVNKTLTLTVTK